MQPFERVSVSVAKYIWFLLLLFLLLVLATGCAGVGGTASVDASANDSRSLIILHTNDFHGHIAHEGTGEGESAGAARIAAYFAAQRATHDNVLVVDAGDAISGTPVSTLFQGVPIFEVMSAMGYDYGLIGNHEFDHGWQQLEAFRAAAEFPLLAATARGPDGQLLGDMPYQIFERGGIRIAIIGVLTDTTPNMITPLGNEGTSFANEVKTLRKLVGELHAQVELIVVLSHTGHSREMQFASAVPDIDVVIGGHSHTRVEEPLVVGNTVVSQAHEFGKAVGRIELRLSNDGTVELVDGRLLSSADLPAPDPAVAAVVARWEEKVSALVDFEIAVAERTILGPELRNWMEHVLRKHTGADLAYYNPGGVRDVIRTGSVTARTLWNIEPFGNSVVTMELTGSEVRAMLQANNDEVAIPLDNARTYRVATNSFVGAHARKNLGDHINLQDLGLLVRDLLLDWVRADGLPGH